MTVSHHFTVTEQDMTAFANISGDMNPLHCEPAFAERRGFHGVVVYGGLLIAQLSRLVGMELPGRDAIWSSLDIQFRNPLYVGEAASLEAQITHLSHATHTIQVKFRIMAKSRLVARGETGILLRSGG